MAKRGRSSRRKARKYHWLGVQPPETVINVAAPTLVVAILMDSPQMERNPGTMIRVRGNLTWLQATTAGNTARAKMMMLQVNDAQNLTGDDQPIDNNEEDIAKRQLWSSQFAQQTVATTDGHRTVEVDIDVKVKIKIPTDGKHIFALLFEAVTANRTHFLLNARCLVDVT